MVPFIIHTHISRAYRSLPRPVLCCLLIILPSCFFFFVFISFDPFLSIIFFFFFSISFGACSVSFCLCLRRLTFSLPFSTSHLALLYLPVLLLPVVVDHRHRFDIIFSFLLFNQTNRSVVFYSSLSRPDLGLSRPLFSPPSSPIFSLCSRLFFSRLSSTSSTSSQRLFILSAIFSSPSDRAGNTPPPGSSHSPSSRRCLEVSLQPQLFFFSPSTHPFLGNINRTKIAA